MKKLLYILLTAFALAAGSNAAVASECNAGKGVAVQEHTMRYLPSGKEKQTTGGVNYMDFGSRMYDDFLGRWFAHDPMSEEYYPLSPYAYCANNPVIFRDYNGEWFGLDDLVAGLIGGVVNLVSNAIQGNIHSIGDGLAAFGSGFVAGDLALYGPLGWAAGGAVVGSTNSWLAGNSGWDIVRDGLVGVAAGLAGGAAGQWAGEHIGGLIINGLHITSPVLQGAVSGIAGGAVGGYAAGFAGGFMMTGDLSAANRAGLNGALVGAPVGGISGSISAYRYAIDNNINPWNGKSVVQEINQWMGVDAKGGMTKVGRWMSQAEYEAMKSTGFMQEGAGGKTSVAVGGSDAFTGATKGSVYVEFEVPTNSLIQGGKPNWYSIIGPNASKPQLFILQKQGGQMLPPVKNLSPILKVK